MNRQDAEKLMLLFVKMSADLDQSVSFVEERDTSNQMFKDYHYREAVGTVMCDALTKVLHVIWDRYPDLKPTFLNGPYKIESEVYEPVFYK